MGASMLEVALTVAAVYPELKAYLPEGSGASFRSNLFDAVAVGVAMSRDTAPGMI